MADGDRKKGRVKWFNDRKSFGFITPDDGSRSLVDGEVVEYTAECGNYGRYKASNVTRGGGGGRGGRSRGYGRGGCFGENGNMTREYPSEGRYSSGGNAFRQPFADNHPPPTILSGDAATYKDALLCSFNKGSMDVSSMAEEKEKVCVLVGINGDMGIYLLDLDQDLKGADANGFVDKLPNFRVGCGYYYYVLKAKLYLFDNYNMADHHPDPPLPPQVYSIDLQAASEMSDCKLDKTDFTKCSACLGPKSLLKTLPYRDTILVFSSEIHFHYYNDENGNKFEFRERGNLMDFELYDPVGNQGRVLPQLIVCQPRFSNATAFMLYDSVSGTYYDEEFTASRKTFDGFSFGVLWFGVDVDEDKFIIGTEFGRRFSLKLDGSDTRWRLCNKEGYEFEGGCKNIVTSNGICLDAFGATDSRTRWLKQERKLSTRTQSDEDGDGRPRRVSFPPMATEIKKRGLIYRGRPYSSAFDFKGDPSCTRMCIARAAFDFDGADQESSSKLYLWLNVLKVDLKKLANDKDEADDEKIVEQLKSFKYALPERIYTLTPYFAGLFYY